MKKVGVVLHREREEAANSAAWLARTLAEHGVEVHARATDAARVRDAPVASSDPLPDDLDLVFVFGGDGTLLHAADLVGDRAPLLGVNFGRLGFLSELERGELAAGLQRILDAGFDVEERVVLEGSIEQPDGAATPVRALNDVIVAKSTIGRSIRVTVDISGERLIEWAADGVIVATSTGSTAYSFSAGGPVVSPRLDCLVVTPVSAHGLFARSVVVPPDEAVTLTVAEGSDVALVSSDGRQEVSVPERTRVTLRASAGKVKLAKVDPAPFWRLLREKLRLPPPPEDA